MEKVDFLPLGSIVIIKGSVRKIMILSRGLTIPAGETTRFFDYGGCFYPDGLNGDQVLYFQHSDIEEVVQKGFSDEDDKRMVHMIHEWMETNDTIKRGTPADFSEK